MGRAGSALDATRIAGEEEEIEMTINRPQERPGGKLANANLQSHRVNSTLVIKLKNHNITVFDDIVFPFKTDFAELPGFCPAAGFN